MTRRSQLTRMRHILGFQIHHCVLPRVATEFLWEVLDRTFETTAHQEQEGVAPLTLWCAFDQEAWAEALSLDGETLRWTRVLLVTAGVLLFVPDARAPNNGTLQWNLAFDDWHPLPPGPAGKAIPREEHFGTDASRDAPSWESADADLVMPSVRLAQRWKGRPPRQVWWAMRLAALKRDDWMCQYCGTRTGPLACDHLVPVSRGGASVLENLVTACTACNSAKGTRTLAEWSAALAQQPTERRA